MPTVLPTIIEVEDPITKRRKFIMKYTIRIATMSDLEQLDHLMYNLHQYHHQQVPQYFKTPEKVQEEKSIDIYLESPDCLVLVAEQDGDIIGFVTSQFCEFVSAISKPVFMGSID